MESDEDTFTLQITDDSGVEDNLNESSDITTNSFSTNADSWRSSDSFGEKENNMSIRILSDNYYDDADDCCDSEAELDHNRQVEVTRVQKNSSESSSEREIIQMRNNSQDNNLKSRRKNNDLPQDKIRQIETENIEAEDNGIQGIESLGKNIGAVIPFLSEKDWKYLQSARDDDGLDVGNIDFIAEKQQIRENIEMLINQECHKNHLQAENVNRDLEDGEIVDSEAEPREKSVELIEVPDEVNDRLFDNYSDHLSEVSTVDNSYYEDFEYDRRNLSPPGDGEFSTFEDDEDPWDYIQSTMSDDCVIVEEIKRPPRFVQSYTLCPEDRTECMRDQADEECAEKFDDDRRGTSRKRKISRFSNCDGTEKSKVSDKNTDVDYDDFIGICTKEEVSELPDEVLSKSRRKSFERDEDHPLFRDIDTEFCEKLMRVKKQGEIIIRPSTKGLDYLKITWKVTDDIYHHLKVKKKLKSRSSSTYRYWINYREFRSLEEIISRYIKPMAQNALKLLQYKHFKKGINGVKATAEELLKAEKNKNPNCIPYIISAVKRSPGKFLISYLPRMICYHEYIKILPEGFRFRDQPFGNLNDLLIYFKANSKEVKPVALNNEIVTSTTPSRPATPRPVTPKVVDLTPSILEVIQDLPDEKLESVKLILDSLAQSTSNQSLVFNQNPGIIDNSAQPASNPPPTFNHNPGLMPFMFKGYHQPYPPPAYPPISYPGFQPPFIRSLPHTNNVPLPVPYPKNLDLPVPNYSQPKTSHADSLPPPPGTS